MDILLLITGGRSPSPLRGEGGVRGAAAPQPLAGSRIRCTTEPLTRLAKAWLRQPKRADLSPQGRGERKSGVFPCVS